MTIVPIVCLALALESAGPSSAAVTQPSQPAPTTMPASAPAGPQLSVLCTTFPIYQFARNVVAGRPNIHLGLLLSPAAGCPHDYVITPQDMQKLATADAVIINGLGMEGFLGPALARANPKAVVIDSSKGIEDLLYMAPEEHERGRDHPHEGDPNARVPNPHLFASPHMAAKVVATIADGLTALDPAGAPVYGANAKAYAGRLEALAKELSKLAAAAANRKIVTEHAVFDYLARDCGLEVVAVVEEAAGQEPSAARMIELVALIKRSGAAAVFTEPQYPANVAETIAREAGVPCAVLDPVATGPADAPIDYYQKVMVANIQTLIETLGVKEPPK